MAKAILFTLLCISLFFLASARPHPLSYLKRALDASASTCSFMQCAVSHGNCATNGSVLIFCQPGEHCDGTNCIDDLALGATCNPNANENECSQGSCVDSGNGPVCQIYHTIVPGAPCTQDSQCYFSTDGVTATASTCSNGVCAGIKLGDACVGSYQCLVGSFCSSATGTCTALGNLGQSCSSDNQCDSRWVCRNSQCSTMYTQNEGQACTQNEDCSDNLYCKSGVCAKGTNAGNTHTPCDIQSNNCGADQTCQCADFNTQGQTATCIGIAGTSDNMASIAKSAYACLDSNKCGSDVSVSSNVQCIKDHCLSSYCTLFTRQVPSLFNDYPSCLVGRMVDNSQYYSLLQSCQDYKEGSKPASTGDGNVVRASLAWVLLVSLAVLFFAL